jgi:hypothetical protein
LTDYHELYDPIAAGIAFPATNTCASGGMVVRNIGKRETNDLVWPEVKVDKTGEYALSFGYAANEEREFDLSVDGGAALRVKAPSSQGKIATVEVRLRLTAGVHRLRLSNASGPAPDIDRMTISAAAK